jgi:thiosulfate/3-mercaptopyruvate sulfurtransferase
VNDPLVSTEWLAAHLTDADLRIFDSTIHLPVSPGERAASGREDYARAHIPGAGFLDLLAELSDTSSAFPFTRPTTDQRSVGARRCCRPPPGRPGRPSEPHGHDSSGHPLGE